MKRITVHTAALVALVSSFVLVPRGALAQAAPDLLTRIKEGAIETVVFGVLGIALLLLGYKAFQLIVPWNVNKEIEADHNTAVAIVLAGLFVGVALIISAVLVS